MLKLHNVSLYGGGKSKSEKENEAKEEEKINTGGIYNPTPTPAPAIKPYPTLKNYITTTWDETAKGQATGQAKADALSALNGQKPFDFSQTGWLDDVLKNIENYGDFSYDINGDALYQQYKDKYIQQGKLAMADTMGQAAAMTGGYENSYAQSVGQQAYQGQLDNLNDVIPELYQLAVDRYNMGKQDLYNQYGLLSDQYNREYGEWNDEYGRLMDAYNVANSDYYDGANLHNSEVANKNSVIGRENDEALGIWEENNQNAWNQAQWEEAGRQNANEEAWRQMEWELISNQATNSNENFMYNADGTLKEGFTTTDPSYFDDNGNFKKAEFLGTTQDGKSAFRISGKTVVLDKGVNPYTQTYNEDCNNGTFSNGYQPNNVGGEKLSKSGIQDYMNGVLQTVWKTPNGKLWIWDGTKNKYEEYHE